MFLEKRTDRNLSGDSRGPDEQGAGIDLQTLPEAEEQRPPFVAPDLSAARWCALVDRIRFERQRGRWKSSTACFPVACATTSAVTWARRSNRR